MKRLLLPLLLAAAAACAPKWAAQDADGYFLIVQEDAPTLGYTSAPILTRNRYAFKDLNRSGELDPYEDWRLPAEVRAKDLAARLSIEEIALPAGLVPEEIQDNVVNALVACHDGVLRNIPSTSIARVEALYNSIQSPFLKYSFIFVLFEGHTSFINNKFCSSNICSSGLKHALRFTLSDNIDISHSSEIFMFRSLSYQPSKTYPVGANTLKLIGEKRIPLKVL